MTESYLDISKSVMISSPAGSGKTEKLARRYIALLKGGSDVERILAITFTEKAAAEMKERILSILRKEDTELFERVREKMPRMRISTIHSFCLKLLRRFCLELGLDISLEVLDSFNADMLWEEAVYESLQEDGKSGERLFYEVIRSNGIKGWDKLRKQLDLIHSKRPLVEAGIASRERGVEIAHAGQFEKILFLYAQCLERYKRKKRERHCIDYNDLELMAYEAVAANPEWQNVLFSFDEHTDHILVDEFQDTSTLQWMIIDKLTEEWRSGMGVKREAGLSPTVFLVGDDKQSIYSFRGANAGIFKNARKRLSEWLGAEYHFIEVKENYRSLPAIVDFVNALFGTLMPRGLYEDWKVEYVPFASTRKGEGKVELILCESAGSIKESRKSEAAICAQKIASLWNTFEIHDGPAMRKCRFGDMAILLRNRTYLSTFEDALRREGIPFVVVKGIGFYHTPEICILRNLLFFLIDPLSDCSLFNLLRSPLFSLDYDALLEIIKDTPPDAMSPGYLQELLASYRSLLEPALAEAIRAVNATCTGWRERVKETPYAVLLEEILTETGAWRFFHEKQRYVNIKKFIKIVESFEAKGLTGLEIREQLIKASAKADEAKANVNTEGMDAVRIMTTHASKGLQFPMVFLPCLDEGAPARSGSIIMDEEGERIIMGYEEDADNRKKVPLFRKYKEKAEDEEKRLFYVAATRAMDYLCMTGVVGKKPTGKLASLIDAFQLTLDGTPDCTGLPFTVERIGPKAATRKEQGPFVAKGSAPRAGTTPSARQEVVFVEDIGKEYAPAKRWREVTEEVDEIRKKHGDDWVVLGRAFHRVFEEISKGRITLEPAAALKERVMSILMGEALTGSTAERMSGTVLSDLKRLEESGYLREIILPRDDAFAELPFILELGKSIYKGRIDRVIVKGDAVYVYDYKTFPVSDDELPELSERYAFQLDIYTKAAERIFSKRAKGYLFFTHNLKLTA
ncbi:MAG: UvrD-helicase domain-containing protein [Nitrospirota bacterium]